MSPNSFVFCSEQITYYFTWLGLNRPVNPCSSDDLFCERNGHAHGGWHWQDGTNYTWHNWYSDYYEPDSDELCALIDQNENRWYGSVCTFVTSPFICERGMVYFSCNVPMLTATKC